MILSALEKGTHLAIYTCGKGSWAVSLTGIYDFIMERNSRCLKGPFISFSVFSLLIPGTHSFPVIPGLDKPLGGGTFCTCPTSLVRLIFLPTKSLSYAFPERAALWGKKGEVGGDGVRVYRAPAVDYLTLFNALIT